MTVVTNKNAKQEIERHMGELVDLLAGFAGVELDKRAWRQLLIYAPHDLIEERELDINVGTRP